MKIVFIFDSIARIGGMERIFTDKMNYFADIFGWDVFLVTYQQGTHPFTFHLSARVCHRDLDCRFLTLYRYEALRRVVRHAAMERRFVRRLSAALDDIRPDVIVCSTYHTREMRAVRRWGGAALRTAESHVCRQRVIDLSGGVARKIRAAWEQHKNSHAVLGMDVVVALTRQDATAWKHVRTVVIPNFVSYYPAAVDYRAESRHVVAAGRLTAQKGMDLLVDIWRRVCDARKGWVLDVYGDGELRETLEERAECYGLHGTIVFHGAEKDIYKRYKESALFLFPSRYEGFGLSLVEAMACGLPVVAFDCPCGPAEILGEGNANLIREGDINAFAARVITLMDSADERRRQSEVNRATARRYTAEKVMPQWKALYESYTSSLPKR